MARMRTIVTVFCALLGLELFAIAASPEQRQRDLAELSEKILASGELNPDPNKAIQEYIPRLQSGTRDMRDKAFGELFQKLMFAYNKDNFPTDGNKQKLSLGLIKFYESNFIVRSTPRNLIVEALAKYGDNQFAKPFILNVLDGSNDDEQNAALRMLGAPGGVSGPEFFDKVKQLAAKRKIKSQAIPTFLARANKEMARPGLIEDLKTTKDQENFIYTAWALQDNYRDPANYRYIVPRLKEFGLASDGRIMNHSFRGGSGIGWIDPDLFSQYVETATNSLDKEAFGIMILDSHLCGPSTVPMLIRMLRNEDPTFRLMAAQGLHRSSGYSLADKKSIKANLKTAIDLEKTASTKAGMEGELKEIEREEQQWNKFLEKHNLNR
jgi:hypothetical protein